MSPEKYIDSCRHQVRPRKSTSRTPFRLLGLLDIYRSINPYSEAQFKTLKYSYDFPGRFGSLVDARAFCEGFFTAYNHDHRHSGIGFRTPASVHFGTAEQVQAHRQVTLDRARAAHPERFGRRPRPPRLPETVWINQPVPSQSTNDQLSQLT